MTCHPSVPKGQWHKENARLCHSMLYLFIVFSFFFKICCGRLKITAFSFSVARAYTLSLVLQPKASINGSLVNLFVSLT
jgi:hypothetical protein